MGAKLFATVFHVVSTLGFRVWVLGFNGRSIQRSGTRVLELRSSKVRACRVMLGGPGNSASKVISTLMGCYKS